LICAIAYHHHRWAYCPPTLHRLLRAISAAKARYTVIRELNEHMSNIAKHSLKQQNEQYYIIISWHPL